ncbi:MAG: ATP-binding protein, partial [Legionella sp.]|nr:ATP-binding protein [Legionella sp.]
KESWRDDYLRWVCGFANAEGDAESDAVLVEKLHLTEGRFLKRAATLLFHADPEKFTTGACVKIGFFRTDSDLLYHDVIEGDLFTQVEKTLDLLLTKYLRAGISYQGTQRLERFPVPEAALREAVINAIAHKDYGALIPIQISVYDHKLIIWNAGQLPPDWSLARLMAKHSSQPANPDIARALFLAGKIESWGRGIDLIRNACLDYGSPAPLFDCDSAGFGVEFPFPAAAEAEKTSVKTSVKTPVEILRLLTATPSMTLAEVAAEIGKTPRAVELATSKLVKNGRLKYVGPQKGGHWEILT